MKKLLLLTSLIIIGCDKQNSDGTYTVSPDRYKTYIIDSCEYYGSIEYGNSSFLTHKGSCKYCAERRRKEIEELVIKLKKE